MKIKKELQNDVFETAKLILDFFENGNGWKYALMVLKTDIGDVGVSVQDNDDSYLFRMVDADAILSICSDFKEAVMSEDKTGGFMQFAADCETMLRGTTFTVV